MLDGRKSWLIGSAMSLVVAACGGAGDIGSVNAPAAEPGPTPEQTETEPSPDVDDDGPPVVSEPEPAPLLGVCQGTDPAPRCFEDPQTFAAYGAAAIVTTLQVLPDAGCCVDFDGDGDSDNALGQGFQDIGKLDQLNDELHASLVSGAQTILLELVGVDDAENDDQVELHVYGGLRVDSSPTSGPEVMLDPSTIAQGVAPLFTFDSAEILDGRLVASQGEIALEARFNGVLLKPVVHDVRLSARIDQITDGLRLREGEVAGRLELRQIDHQINAIAGDCPCLALDGPLVTDGECATPDRTACEVEGNETCAALAEVCPVLELIASNIADVDSDADGTVDSISLGALVEADPARITGVMR